jgi:dTMP kinase
MFISFEGIEGSGKSSLIPHVKAHLESRGMACTVTREPGGTGIGRRIRAILLDPRSSELEPAAELLLYTADRLQHVQTVIRPALAAGRVVLCDRYVDATRAYQGWARQMGIDLVDRLHVLALEGLMPDLTILLDLEPRIGLGRAWKAIDSGQRDGDETRFEHEAIRFHESVREGYLRLADQDPHRFRCIDAAGPEPAVRRAVISEIDQWASTRTDAPLKH